MFDNTNTKITDIDLSRQFGDSINENYVTALEFLSLNSDYSLMKFRLIIEDVAVLIAHENDVSLQSNTLFEQIKELYHLQLIEEPLKDTFHELRMDKPLKPDINQAPRALLRALIRVCFSSRFLSEKRIHKKPIKKPKTSGLML